MTSGSMTLTQITSGGRISWLAPLSCCVLLADSFPQPFSATVVTDPPPDHAGGTHTYTSQSGAGETSHEVRSRPRSRLQVAVVLAMPTPHPVRGTIVSDEQTQNQRVNESTSASNDRGALEYTIGLIEVPWQDEQAGAVK